jgi:hypothetical protein
LSTKQKQGRAPLERVLECMLADFGLIQPPSDGCPVRPVEASAAAIRQIVAEVMEELGRRGAI